MRHIYKKVRISGLFCFLMRGDSELFNYLAYTLSLNCVQNVFTLFRIYKIKLKIKQTWSMYRCSDGIIEKKRFSCYGI